MKNIYVSIASYRDSLLQSTIDNIFKMSSGLNNIFVGVFIQKFASDLPYIINDYFGKVKYIEVEAGSIFSVGNCRNRANEWLDNSYDYVLQIDGHTRFENNWDEILVKEHQGLSKKVNSKILFSTYLSGWIPGPTEILKEHNSKIVALATFNTIESKKFFFNTYELVPDLAITDRKSNDAVNGWYLCGHFIFGPAEYFLNVVQPKWILFWGEEVYHSFMAFTNGWDVYIPYSAPVRHMYPQDVNDYISLNKLWNDFSLDWELSKIKSTNLIIDNLINKITGEEFLGTKRSLDKMYQNLGYDPVSLFVEWRKEYELEFNRQIH